MVVALEPHPFDLEVGLQELLESYPRLLLAAGGPYANREIWTIGYEVPVPAGSIDLLMLDSAGEVWVVETKLRKNPEVKKQVVGQVLGYAACVAEWTADKLDAVALEYQAVRGDGESTQSLLQRLGESVGMETAEEIIDKAADRIRQGDITAVVVVDEIPTTLQRTVEFVNEHSTFDLLAIQVEVIEHEGTQFVIPRVTGSTVSKPGSVDDASYDDLLDRSLDTTQQVAERMAELAARKGWKPVKQAKSLKYVQDDGSFILRIYPRWDSTQLWLSILYEAGLDDLANSLRQELAAITGKQHPMKEISIPTSIWLAKWDELVAFLDHYLDARRQAARVLDDHE